MIEVQNLRLEPGDVVVLTAPGAISDEIYRRLKEKLEPELGQGVKVICLGDGLRVDSVLRRAAQ